MRFSLIVCTVDRIDEPARLFASLEAQTFRDFEVIVVDQNDDQRLIPILDTYADSFPIAHLISRRGLSRARNVGLERAGGEVLAFPDDDCWYAPDVLEHVDGLIRRHPQCSGFSGRITQPEAASPGRLGEPIPLSVRNLWGRVPSAALFAHRDVVDRIGGFDEGLGVGAGTPFGAGEDTDWVLRSMAEGMRWIHDPSLAIFHPPRHRGTSADDVARAGNYARGLGRVLRKNDVPLWMVAGGVGLSALRWTRSMFRGNRGQARLHRAELVGRVAGWVSSGKGGDAFDVNELNDLEDGGDTDRSDVGITDRAPSVSHTVAGGHEGDAPERR